METMTAEVQKLRKHWHELDTTIRDWWDADLHRAQEDELRDPAQNVVWYTDDEHRKMEGKDPGRDSGTLLFLPYPYVTGGGSESSFPEMYCWDIFFINQALLLHGRPDIVRNHILNQLFMIERFGMVLNGNRTYYLPRSQTPLLAESIRRYHRFVADRDLLAMAYPLLKREYQKYWTAPHPSSDCASFPHGRPPSNPTHGPRQANSAPAPSTGVPGHTGREQHLFEQDCTSGCPRQTPL
jgi:alpha,alpha-trehalase